MGGTKTSKFHDIWIFEPWGTHISGFQYTKLLQKYQNDYVFLEIIILCEFDNLEIEISEMLHRLFWTFEI